MFVDRETILPRSDDPPTGNGKIGTSCQVRTIQAHRQQDSELFVEDLRTEDPSTHAPLTLKSWR